MELYRRDGVWHARGYYWDARTGGRKRWRRSTGVRDDGTARTEQIARQTGHQIAQSYAIGSVRRARALTLQNAIDLLIADYELRGLSQASINIIIEKANPLR